MMAGPYATRYLADLGADVIKIEPPDGDYIRTRPPLRGGCSAYFGHLNAGKRSVVLDLKRPGAMDAVRSLAAISDVVVENFRPGVMKRLGLDYPAVSEINPKIVMCSISGFGQDGPGADRAAYAQIVQACSGYDLAFAKYQGTAGRPANTAIFFADVLAGVYAYSAILATLHQRHATGRGTCIDASLIESMLQLMPYEVQEAQFPVTRDRPVYPPFRTADGYVMISAISPKNFEALLQAIGIAGWRDDPILATDAARQANWMQVMQRIEAWTSQRPSAECERRLLDAGVPATAYRTVAEAIADPQLAHRGSLATVEDAGGRHLVPNLPFRMSGALCSVAARTPALGEHTREVLSDLLKLDDAAIARITGGSR